MEIYRVTYSQSTPRAMDMKRAGQKPFDQRLSAEFALIGENYRPGSEDTGDFKAKLERCFDIENERVTRTWLVGVPVPDLSMIQQELERYEGDMMEYGRTVLSIEHLGPAFIWEPSHEHDRDQRA